MTRTCCDGRCTRPGGHCPAFAPGVIESHRAPRNWRRVVLWLGAALVLLGVTLVACVGPA